jgi:hypothetical protein
MCSSSTFLSHTYNIFFFLPSYLFWWVLTRELCRYGDIMVPEFVGVFLGPLNEASGSTINILWWYRPSFYGGLCPICFCGELGSSGSVFVF